MISDQVYCLRGAHQNSEEWMAIVSGKVYGPWPDKGAALAGLATEKRRAVARVKRPSARGENEENIIDR